MANEEHPAILRHGVDVWNAWWAELHHAELLADWDLARQQQPLAPIAPLSEGGAMSDLIHVLAVEPREPPIVHVRFSNGEERDIDVTAYIADGPIFAPVRDDPAFFRAVGVEGDTIAWPNGADIDPEMLYYDLGPNASEAAWRAARAAHIATTRP